jgi:hypothetical protein
MTVPKLAGLEPIKLALKSALTKSNIRRCLPASKKRACGDVAEEMFTALEAAPAVSCVRNGTVRSRHQVLVTRFLTRFLSLVPEKSPVVPQLLASPTSRTDPNTVDKCSRHCRLIRESRLCRNITERELSLN